MHHDVRYNDPDPAVNEVNAMQDIKDYLGEERFTLLHGMAIAEKNNGKSREFFEMALTFAGISGYPVEVWADRIGFPPYKEESNDDSD